MWLAEGEDPGGLRLQLCFPMPGDPSVLGHAVVCILIYPVGLPISGRTSVKPVTLVLIPRFMQLIKSTKKKKKKKKPSPRDPLFYSMCELPLNECCSDPFQGSLTSETFQTGANRKDFSLFSFKAKDKNVTLHRCNSILENKKQCSQRPFTLDVAVSPNLLPLGFFFCLVFVFVFSRQCFSV